MPRRNSGPKLRWLEKRNSYYITWTENGRSRERSCGTSHRREAEAALESFLAQRRKRVGPRDPSEFPIVDALADYGTEHAPHTHTPARIGYAIASLTPFWAENTIGNITPNTCRAYAKWRGKSDGTIRKELGILRAAINHEVKNGRLTRPVSVWLPPKPPNRERWLTRSEAARLLNAARNEPHSRLHLPLFILIGLYTGARKGAILDLRWPQIDLEKGRIDFNPPGRRQTNKGRPVIPIPRRLMTFLRLAKRRGSDLGYVVHINGQKIGDVKKGFAGAAYRAGLYKDIGQIGNDGKPILRIDVTPHTLRHTAATWMARQGVPLWEIAGWLGQSHARTTELYAHHHPDFLKVAKKAMDQKPAK